MSSLDDVGEMDWLMNLAAEDSIRFLLERAIPTLKQFTLDALMDLVFCPRIVAKQLLLALVLETGRFGISSTFRFLLHHAALMSSSRSRLLRQLNDERSVALTQDDYIRLSERIDAMTGDQEWRMDPTCPLYEQERIVSTIHQYLHLMRRRQAFDLMFVLRGNLSRNRFGLLHKGLFSKAQAGTKVLVETYHNVVCAALEYVCDTNDAMILDHGGLIPSPMDHHGASVNHIPTEARLAFFNEVRHAYGRSSLLLSGGAALGFYHVGVVKTLMENNLMPRVIGGSSAGSIVCAMLGTRTDEECMLDFFQLKGTHAPGHSGIVYLEFFRPLAFQSRDYKQQRHYHHSTYGNNNNIMDDHDAHDMSNSHHQLQQQQHHYNRSFSNATTWIKRIRRLFAVPVAWRQLASTVFDVIMGYRPATDLVMHDTEHFKATVKANVGNFTFQEAFDRTGRICNIIVSPKNQSDPPRLLNYLTAPHVLVWSAAVASSSVPGIFEADCLMVRDPDGTERHESSTMTENGKVRFSDGSFEQDLPMQQLSEMFNINHFIVSQVNPQAVLLGSYNHRTSVWSNPLKGLVDSLLRFLKGQCRTWLVNCTKFLASGRFRPLYAQTRSNIGTHLLTQEYEGRDCDISLIPWLHHRTLTSAFFHMLYNPSRQEFFDWLKAAERETWKFIPRIKCHIAEEIALDQCVQRLRNRLILEARQNRRGVRATNTMIGNGLPSFFVSPSLTNLETSGNAVPPVEPIRADQTYGTTSSTTTYQLPLKRDCKDILTSVNGNTELIDFDVNSGWAGLGLKGNRSSGSLERHFSQTGLFIDDDENPQQPPELHGVAVSGKHPSTSSLRSSQRNASFGDGITTRGSMATFYYRRASETNLAPTL